MNVIYVQYVVLITALWLGVNGILHDFFVIRNHKTGYDKDLLRLLMDGHLLIFSGVLMLVSWLMIRESIIWGPLLGAIVSLSMIVYCLMIFPFLKSFGTLFLSLITLVACLLLIFIMT